MTSIPCRMYERKNNLNRKRNDSKVVEYRWGIHIFILFLKSTSTISIISKLSDKKKTKKTNGFSSIILFHSEEKRLFSQR